MGVYGYEVEVLTESFKEKRELKQELQFICNSITTYMSTLNKKDIFDKCTYDKKTFNNFYKERKDYFYFSAQAHISDAKKWRDEWANYVEEFNANTEALTRAINKKFKDRLPAEIKEIKALKTTGNIKVDFKSNDN